MKRIIALIATLFVAVGLLVTVPVQSASAAASAYDRYLGEPKCTRSWPTFKKDCSARNMYRMIATKTTTTNMKERKNRLKASILIVGSAISRGEKSSNNIKSDLNEKITGMIPLIDTKHTKCSRQAILDLIARHSKQINNASNLETTFKVASKFVAGGNPAGKMNSKYMEEIANLIGKSKVRMTYDAVYSFQGDLANCHS